MTSGEKKYTKKQIAHFEALGPKYYNNTLTVSRVVKWYLMDYTGIKEYVENNYPYLIFHEPDEASCFVTFK